MKQDDVVRIRRLIGKHGLSAVLEAIHRHCVINADINESPRRELWQHNVMTIARAREDIID